MASDSTFRSAEFMEYEQEFRRYMEENLRTQQPQQDFTSELQEECVDLETKVDQLVAWWREARHVVVFTGAGVSTAAGLPDYRGPQGIWTRKLRGEAVSDDLGPTVQAACPTLTHRAIASLQQAGRVAFVVTTNVDGLHGKAGLLAAALSELHGNLYVEECASCGQRYSRSFPVRTATGLFEHKTGRSCTECGGDLRDIIVNFGNTIEHVPSMEAVHDQAWVQCLKADLVLVLGSSLSVASACDLPEECLAAQGDKPAGGRLVIVGRQRTPKDSLAAACIRADCDDVMRLVQERLQQTR